MTENNFGFLLKLNYFFYTKFPYVIYCLTDFAMHYIFCKPFCLAEIYN
jgi:hypothetical protein